MSQESIKKDEMDRFRTHWSWSQFIEFFFYHIVLNILNLDIFYFFRTIHGAIICIQARHNIDEKYVVLGIESRILFINIHLVWINGWGCRIFYF